MSSNDTQEISKLREEILSLKENDELNNIKILNFEENLNKKDETIQKLNSENQTLKEDSTKWHGYYKNQIAKLEESNKELKNSLKDKKKIIKELKEEKDKFKENYETLSKNNFMLQKQIIEKEKEISNLKIIIKPNQNDYEKLKADLQKLQGEKNELIKQNSNLNKVLEELNINKKDYIQLNNKDYEKLIADLQKLEDEKNELIKQNSNLNKNLKDLQDEKNELVKQNSNNSNINIKDLINEKNELAKQNIMLNNKLNNMIINGDKSYKYENIYKEDFYDLIIKCNSIIGLQNGWEVSMTEEGKKNYNEYKNMKYTKVGVIGSENRGKSTILSDFSKIELPTGASIKTEGLSIKYPKLEEFKNRKIILLDSAGLETPILKTDNGEQEEKNANKPIETMEKANEDIKNGDKKESVQDFFENKSRDIIQLELFLQNFIIKYSDILILILGKLTINEQKLLLKVNTHIKNLNRKESLIVIHNLKEFETKKQVEDYIKDVLKKSSTFTLEENFDINFKKNEESGWRSFFEPKSEPKIYHLIYAKKGTEAGDYYNGKAIDYLYHLITSITDKECFDPIECIKNYFSEISETILENPIKKEDLIYNDNNKKDINDEKGKTYEINQLSLKERKQPIILKKCLIDELGIIQGNNFNVQYSYYITDKNVFVYVELPGKYSESDKDLEYENVVIEQEVEGSYYIIKIRGTKKNNYKKIINVEEATQFNKRQFGKFEIQIKLDKINLTDDDFVHEIKNGCLLIKFNIKKKANAKLI